MRWLQATIHQHRDLAQWAACIGTARHHTTRCGHMSELPGHFLPTYSDESREDALFHYTTATGLVGMVDSGEIWGTAYYRLISVA